jgi:hypothetical protein
MSRPGFSGYQYIVDIPAAGSFVELAASTATGRVVIRESPITSSGAPNPLQGALQYQLPNDTTNANDTDGFTTIFQENGAPLDGLAQVATIELADGFEHILRCDKLIANGPNQGGQGIPPAPALVYCKISSATTMPTSIVVREYF